MGWSSWNKHGCDINEKIIRDTADTMVSSGLAAAGYTFVNVDDCWSAPKRDPITNRLQADPDRFPSGMKALGDYIHSKGLKFGLYSDSGVWTCAFKLGSGNFEQIDAEAFAEWGVDYLKYDNCFTNFFEKASERFAKMSSALKNTSRSIFYSVCNVTTFNTVGARESLEMGAAHQRFLENIWRYWRSLGAQECSRLAKLPLYHSLVPKSCNWFRALLFNHEHTRESG